MRSIAQLRREQELDHWIEGGSDYTDELSPQVAELARAALLVREYVETPARLSPGRRSYGVIVRIAAVLLVMIGLGIGLAVAASQSGSSGPAVPMSHLRFGKMPAALLAEIEPEAGISGDPQPAVPVLWVKTTASAIDQWLLPYQMPSQSHMPPGLVEWVAQVSGKFYGNAAERSGPFSSMLFAWVPFADTRRYSRGTFSPGGMALGFPAVPLSVLEQLGTVHRQYLVAPRYAPPAPAGPDTGVPTSLPPAVRSILQAAVVAYRPFNRTLSLQWVGLTAGQLRAKVPWSNVPASVPSNYSVWIVQLSQKLCCAIDSSGGFPTQWWYLWPKGSGVDEAPSDSGADLLGISRLSQLGNVHSIVGENNVLREIGLSS